MKLTKDRPQGLLSQISESCAQLVFEQDVQDAYVELVQEVPFETDGQEFVLFPACCYDGNRFDVLKKDYPPLFTDEEARVDMPITISDVPRLNQDGSGVIEVTAGDVSVPCVGVFSRKYRKAFFLFTIQHLDGINLGLSYEGGKIGITYPHMRKKEMYRWPHMVPSTDRGIDFREGQTITIPYRLFTIDCEDMRAFYSFFFRHRKCMGMDDSLTYTLDPEKHFAIHAEKFNKRSWNYHQEYYGTGVAEEGKVHCSTGWSAIYTYSLMKLGGELEWERGKKTVAQILRSQDESGLIHYFCDTSGVYIKSRAIVRKTADTMHFLLKIFSLMQQRGEQVPDSWEQQVKKMADALVMLWKRYGQFGQYADAVTGDMIVGGSESCGLAPAALLAASKYFGVAEYLTVAEESLQAFCQKVLETGCTTGSAWEMLLCPDGEGCFLLLESLADLYEHTGESRWLEYGKYMLELSSSWVVAYNYRFPETSEFYRLNMQTTGCVFANAQNKHAAPGICSLSGRCVYRFYRWTGDEAYLQLYREITRSVKQFMSTQERPICSWTAPMNTTLVKEEEWTYQEPERLLPGYICERVNMSDWETEQCIGGVYNHSCAWCEATSLITLAECRDE